MFLCCFKRSMKQTVHLSDRSLSDWAIQFRAIVFLKICLNRSGEGHNFFNLWLGKGHNFFVSVQGEGQNILGALFKKLVALTPPPPLPHAK